MAGSVYVQFFRDRPTELQEGEALPCLKYESNSCLRWAYAIKPPDDKKKNLLLAALFQAAGFDFDVNNATLGQSAGCHFYYANKSLIDGIPSDYFVSFPPGLDSSPDGFVVPDSDLVLKDGAQKKKVKDNAQFSIGKFLIERDEANSFFLLGEEGKTSVAPHFKLTIRLDALKVAKPPVDAGFADAVATTFTLAARAEDLSYVAVVRLNNEVLKPNNAEEFPGDSRQHRLVVDNGAASYDPNSTAPNKLKLRLDLIPAFRFRPDEDLPVTVTVACGQFSVQFDADSPEPFLYLRIGRPCIRITVAGPMIHAEEPRGGAQWLRLLEPAQQLVGESVSQINDFLSYTFELCLPEEFLGITWNLDGINKYEDLWKNEGLLFATPNEFLRKLFGCLTKLLGLPWLKELDFDFGFLDIGPPPAFPGFTVAAPPKTNVLKIGDLLGGLEKIQVPGLDFRKLRFRIRASWELPRVLNIGHTEVELSGKPTKELRIGDCVEFWHVGGGVPKLLGNWRIRSLSGMKLRFDTALNFGLGVSPADLRLCLWRPKGFKVFRLKEAPGSDTEYTFDLPDNKFPQVSGCDIDTGFRVDVFPDLDLSLLKFSLNDLLGDMPGVNFGLNIPDPTRQDLPSTLNKLDASNFSIPFELSIRIPKLPPARASEFPTFKLWLGVAIDLAKPQMRDNKIYFYFPQVEKSSGDATGARADGAHPEILQQAVDLDLFTLSIPMRQKITQCPDADSHDGYIDIAKREFVIDLVDRDKQDPAPKILAYFPGGVSDDAVRLGVEGLEKKVEQEGKPEDKKLLCELKRRFQLELKPLKDWPEVPKPFVLRLNAGGITLNAELLKSEVEVDTSGTEESNGTTGLMKAFKLQPQEKRGNELRSRLVIIDNALRAASIYAKTTVPGTDNLSAQVEVGLRQTRKGQLPDVFASMELERTDASPLAEFSISLLELKLKRLELGLTWYREQHDWDYKIIADGSIGFTNSADVIPDLKDLKVPTIEVVGLDLRKMNLKQIRIPLKLDKPVRFEILSKMFAVELGDLELSWEWQNGLPRPRLFACKLAKFTFQKPGALEVHVSAGGLQIEFDENLTARIRFPSRLGLEVAFGPSARFSGEVGWVDDRVLGERYLFASGTVALEGLPEATALLKFGTGLKENGQRQINVVLYAGIGLDYPLVSGVVVKGLGAGIGINNRLTAVPALPSADAVLKNIDKIEPEKIDSWQFVREDGFYLSIVGRVVLAATQGKTKLIQSYVATLVLSIDTNFDLVAAGKVWLSCSVDGVRAHPHEPALVGALVFSPRQRKLEVAVESRPDPFIEKNDLLKKLFKKGRLRLTFRITPDLVDYYLEEVSYQDEMFGAQMQFRGSYRFAIFRETVLVRSDLSATGHLEKSLRAGPGGFDFSAQVRLAVGYGGILSTNGILAYAYLDASATFRVKAWIEIRFEKSFRIFRKRITISWTLRFSISAPNLELTLRGHLGVSDKRSGVVGIDIQVGINISICGYRLRASGRLAINPEIYEEARGQVARFERELDNAIKAMQKTSRGTRSVADRAADSAAAPIAAAPVAAAVALASEAVTMASLALAESNAGPHVDTARALLDRAAVAVELKREAARPLGSARDVEEEDWLVYQTPTGLLFLPSPREKWLTPQFAQIEAIELSKAESGKTRQATITCKNHGLDLSASGQTITLLGLRARSRTNNAANAAVIEKLNDSWTLVTEDAGEGKFKLERIASEDVAQQTLKLDKDFFGGSWCVAPKADESALPQFLDDVQRIVLRRGEWVNIREGAVSETNDTLKLTCVPPPDLKDGVRRVVIRKPDGTVLAAGSLDVSAKVTGVNGTSVTVQISAGSIPAGDSLAGWQLAPCLELATPWNAGNHRALAASLSGEESAKEAATFMQAAAAFIESAAPSNKASDLEVPDYRAYRVHFDCRYETSERHWMAWDDQFRLPDGILSTRFRPLDKADDQAEASEVEDILDYQEKRLRLVKQELHETLDQADDEKLQESRAQMSRYLADCLEGKVGALDLRAETPIGNDKDFRFGYMFAGEDAKVSLAGENDDKTLPVGEYDNRLCIRRSAGQVQRVKLRVPQEKDDLSSAVKTLPVRQEFVVDAPREESGQSEKGRVLVKLPLRIHDSIFSNNLEVLGHFQVFRRYPWQTKSVLIANHLSLDIAFLHEPEKAHESLSGTYEEDDPPRPRLIVADSPLNPLNPYPGLVGLIVADRETGHSLALIDDYVPKGPGNPNVYLLLSRKLPKGTGTVTFDILTAGSILPSPYIFTDELAVVDRQFADPDLVSHGFRPDHTRVTYSLRVVPHGEAGLPETIAEETLVPWPSVALHIPAPDLFPRKLAVAIPVAGLVVGPLGTRNARKLEFEFELVTQRGETTTPAMLGDRPLETRDFELWASELALQQTGFYAGADTQPKSPKPTDNSRLTLDDVPKDDLLESCEGKFRLEVADTKEGRFVIQNAGQMRLGFGYRLFIRPANSAANGLLSPLDHLLVREFPTTWDNSVRYRQAEQIECFGEEMQQKLDKGQAELLEPDEFAVDDLVQDGQNALRTTWKSRSLFDGGAEIVIQDRDDTGLMARQLCEVLEEDRFHESRIDFSNVSFWELSKSCQRERVSLCPLKGKTPPNTDPKVLEAVFVGSIKDNELFTAVNETLATLQSRVFKSLGVSGQCLTQTTGAEVTAKLSIQVHESKKILEAYDLPPVRIVLTHVTDQVQETCVCKVEKYDGVNAVVTFTPPEGFVPEKWTEFEIRCPAGWKTIYCASVINGYGEGLGPAGEFLACVYDIRKSPMNLRIPRAEAIADLIPVLVQRLFTGLKLPSELNTTAAASVINKFREDCLAQEAVLRKSLEEALQAPPGDMGEDAGNVFLDRNTARKLAGYLQRRQAIADDVVRLKDPKDSHSSRLPSAPSEVFAQEDAWKRDVDDAKSLLVSGSEFASSLPLTAKLEQAVSRDTVHFVEALLDELTEEYLKLLNDPAQLSNTVRRAYALNEFLQKIEDYSTAGSGNAGRSILKRPHHELLTTQDEAGQTEAQPTPLGHYLPDDARPSAPDRLPPVPAPHIRQLPVRVGRLVFANSSPDKRAVTRIMTADNGDLSRSELRDFQRWQENSTPKAIAVGEEAGRVYVATLNGDGKTALIRDGHSGAFLHRCRFEDEDKNKDSKSSSSPKKDELAAAACVFAETAQGTELFVVANRDSSQLHVGESCFVGYAWNLQQSATRARFFGPECKRCTEYVECAKCKGCKTCKKCTDDKDAKCKAGGECDEGKAGKADESSVATAIAYAPRSRVVAVGTDKGEVYLWNDLGKGDRTAPDRPWTCDPKEAVSQILPIRVPKGEWLAVVAGSTAGSTVRFVDTAEAAASSSRTHADIKPESEKQIQSIAYDSINLRLAIATETEVELHDIANEKSSPEKVGVSGAKCVRFLRSGETTCLVVSGEDWIRIYQRTEVPAGGGGWHEIDKIPGTKISALETHFAPAVATSTSRSLVALFNLWERMGFALDIGLVDERNQLLRRPELLKVINDVAKDVAGDSKEEAYSTVLVLPQEPDGGFRPEDKVGYSFVKVARVPIRFHMLCMQAGPVHVGRVAAPDTTSAKASDKTPATAPDKTPPETPATPPDKTPAEKEILLKLDGDPALDEMPEGCWAVVLSGKAEGQARNIKSKKSEANGWALGLETDFSEQPAPGDMVAVVDPKHESLCELQKWLKMRSVELPFVKFDVTSPPSTLDPAEQKNLALAILQILHLREMARYCGPLPEDGVPVEFDMEPQAERWLTVPALAGWSHSAWAVPDRHGHRFRVAVRRVSRYEPLVRWWLGKHEPLGIPTEECVDHGEIKSIDGACIELQAQVACAKPGMRLDIVRGDGAGQRRNVLRCEAGKVYIDPGDPWLEPVKPNTSEYRLVAESSKWSSIALPPLLDPCLNEGPQPVTVYQYPRAREVVFSYQIPPEGQRAIYNQISRIRTGYEGVEQTFRYVLLDRPEDDPKRIDCLLSDVLSTMDEAPEKPDACYTDMPSSETKDIRLFRHERLVTLPFLPFYYRYRLDVRSLFASRAVYTDRSVDADLLPSAPVLSPLAERQPSRLRLQQPAVAPFGKPIAKGLCQLETDRESVILNGLDLPTLERIAQEAEVSFLGITLTTEGKPPVCVIVKGWNGAEKRLTLASPDSLEAGDYSFALYELECVVGISANDDHLTQEERRHAPDPVVVQFQSKRALGKPIAEGKCTLESGGESIKLKELDDTVLQQIAKESAVSFLEITLKPEGKPPMSVGVKGWCSAEEKLTLASAVSLEAGDYPFALSYRLGSRPKSKEPEREEPDGGYSNCEAKILASRLPDCAMDYGLFWNTSDNGDPIFMQAGWVRMPWSNDFLPGEELPMTFPQIRVSEELGVLSDSLWFRVEKNREPTEAKKPTEVNPLVSRILAKSLPTPDLDALTVTLTAYNGPIFYGVDGSAETPLTPGQKSPNKLLSKLRVRTESDVPVVFCLELEQGMRLPCSRLAVPLEMLGAGSDDLAWRVKFTLRVAPGSQAFRDPTRYRLQAARYGIPTQPVPFDVRPEATS